MRDSREGTVKRLTSLAERYRVLENRSRRSAMEKLAVTFAAVRLAATLHRQAAAAQAQAQFFALSDAGAGVSPDFKTAKVQS